MSRLLALVIVVLVLGTPGFGLLARSAEAATPPTDRPLASRPKEDRPTVWPADAVRRTPAWVMRSVRNRYIVDLRDDAPVAPGAFADRLAGADELIVTHVYRIVHRAFAAYIPPKAFGKIERHPW